MTKVTLPLTPGSTRKDYPLYSGLFRYFPHALAYVSHVSKVANDQHNPGEPLHWAREKSTDHADCLLRHLLNKGEVDEDGVLEAGKVAWRALALLEEELEKQGVKFDAEALSSEADKLCKAWGERIENAAPKTLYDWSFAPKWAKWCAVDGSSGEAHWFREKPKYDLELRSWGVGVDYQDYEFYREFKILGEGGSTLEARPFNV